MEKLDKIYFSLDRLNWKKFKRILKNPGKKNYKLADILSKKAPWEEKE